MWKMFVNSELAYWLLVAGCVVVIAVLLWFLLQIWVISKDIQGMTAKQLRDFEADRYTFKRRKKC